MTSKYNPNVQDVDQIPHPVNFNWPPFYIGSRRSLYSLCYSCYFMNTLKIRYHYWTPGIKWNIRPYRSVYGMTTSVEARMWKTFFASGSKDQHYVCVPTNWLTQIKVYFIGWVSIPNCFISKHCNINNQNKHNMLCG